MHPVLLWIQGALQAVAPFVVPISWAALGAACTVAGWLLVVGRKQGKQDTTLEQHGEALRLLREDDLPLLWANNREQDARCQTATGAMLSALGEIKGKVDILVADRRQ